MKKDNKYQLTVNEVFKFNLSTAGIESLDLIESERDVFHVLSGQKSYEAKIIKADFENKTVDVSINGRLYRTSIADEFDLLVDKMGLANYATQKVKDIKAPMPGLVLDVAVIAGQEVVKGDKLLILEAMKMENVIKSEGEGIVKEIHVKKGAAVDKGQLMIEMG